MVYLFGAMLGALLLIGVLNRIARWIIGRRLTPVAKAFAANAFAAVVGVCFSAWRASDGGQMAWGAGLYYLLPVAAWLAIDLSAIATAKGSDKTS
ncbi:hypothetical protein ATDW_05390 [Asticcacaulis sp. DW145]|uniref:hypothetical protein n=1 Tax=Asticcacaulis sp. DW145 TaxID=3095608 RepID=UPI003085AD68|nr:hypothetical protein ATDW_05390 [Asticcacaulis sp. DW145]